MYMLLQLFQCGGPDGFSLAESTWGEGSKTEKFERDEVVVGQRLDLIS